LTQSTWPPAAADNSAVNPRYTRTPAPDHIITTDHVITTDNTSSSSQHSVKVTDDRRRARLVSDDGDILTTETSESTGLEKMMDPTAGLDKQQDSGSHAAHSDSISPSPVAFPALLLFGSSFSGAV